MKKWLKRTVLCLLLLMIAGAGVGWWLIRGSLPRLEGEQALVGLSAPVNVTRDALGVVTIDAANETDALRALGYVHAQERFFEMDLMRRVSAGELSALFGSVAVEKDKAQRMHRIRARVEANLDASLDGTREQAEAYADGVNAGLAALQVKPWPYLLLRQTPKRWTPTDSMLAGYAMYFDLQDSENTAELSMWRLKSSLPPALYALLARDGSRWDAALEGAARGDATLPSADVIDLRKLPAPNDGKHHGIVADDIVPGSNSFAVAASATRDGRAIVANDMHLGLRAPGIWFRARLRYADARAPDGKVDVTGFTLPGLPLIVVGSNTHIAWGFTNSYVDTADWRIETACKSVATASCVKPVVHHETIDVAGGKPVGFDIEETNWGPVLHREGDRLFSLRWNGHLKGALGYGLSQFPLGRDLDHARVLADQAAIPTQNLLIADAGGRIGWRLIGPLAERDSGCQPAQPMNADAPCDAWHIATNQSPSNIDPESGRLWTANNRTTDGDNLAYVGNGGYALGARAKQIRDDLFARKQISERDLLELQLDDRALFLTPWWSLLRDTAAQAKSPALAELAAASKQWLARASIDSVSYRIVREWRLAVHARIVDGLTAPAQVKLGDRFEMPAFGQLEGVAWPLVSQRPMHLLSRKYSSWDALLEDAAKEVADELKAKGPLSERTWGERNTMAVCHPLANAVPLLGKHLLCMPPDQVPGDGAMPRVVAPSFGASERMVVSPGHEAEGITHMPGGQSGHPMSPFWGAGHDDWVKGRPTPFLPGKVRYTLKLTPGQ